MLREFLALLWQTFAALCRLLLLSIIFILNGVHQIIFNKNEVINVVLQVLPNNNERDKMSYIMSLVKNNVDLESGTPIPPQNSFDSAPFREDDDYESINDDDFYEDDNDDEDGDENGKNNK